MNDTLFSQYDGSQPMSLRERKKRLAQATSCVWLENEAQGDLVSLLGEYLDAFSSLSHNA